MTTLDKTYYSLAFLFLVITVLVGYHRIHSFGEPIQITPSIITPFKGELWAPHITVTSTPIEIKTPPVKQVKQCLHVGDGICN